ncbi:helix-turn-helix transcriptional regulator [Pseudobacillus sp. FSL P4-0506]|uniref:helix-turn-helix domain-containing protein n=1 Tax=Pseudobacillus sp. FSL P4-0506 TaxID=2921576 RepID=UPI0030FA1BEF
METLNLSYIQKRRKELDLSLQEMANKMGFKNGSTYMKYEKGTYSFKAEQLPLLARYLKCNITDFFDQNVAKIATIE